MSTQTEAERFGIGLASAGVALLGSLAGFGGMSLAGLNTGSPFTLLLFFFVGAPALFVAAFLALVGFAAKWRLHPFTTALGTVIGSLIAFFFTNVFFIFGLLFFPGLFTLAAFLVSRYVLERPPLSLPDLAVVACATLLVFGSFAIWPLSIALGGRTVPNCSDGCGPSENLVTGLVVLALVGFVLFAAASCYRGFLGRLFSPRRPSDV
jgi:hypothetical protein